MNPATKAGTFLWLATLSGVVASCGSGNGSGHAELGLACIPSDEGRADFGGYDASQVVVDTESPECGGDPCLVVRFQGRVTCPYGQGAATGGCKTADGAAEVSVPVRPQQEARPPADAVYCSCRCAGPDPDATYCDCASGFTCTELISDLLRGTNEAAGSYCVKAGKLDAPATTAECDASTQSCG
jgi:hypothetical protein